MQKRFRKTAGGNAAELWVDLGPFRYTAELYENGECVQCKRGARPGADEVDTLLSGKHFAALLRISPDRNIRCTWAR